MAGKISWISLFLIIRFMYFYGNNGPDFFWIYLLRWIRGPEMWLRKKLMRYIIYIPFFAVISDHPVTEDSTLPPFNCYHIPPPERIYRLKISQIIHQFFWRKNLVERKNFTKAIFFFLLWSPAHLPYHLDIVTHFIWTPDLSMHIYAKFKNESSWGPSLNYV